jgi:hypothetical protein
MNYLKHSRSIIRGLYKHWLTVAFFLGFITDLILLNRVDDLLDNIILLTYAVLATVSLLLLYVGVAEKGPAIFVRFFNRYMPMVMQYAFGGLLSGMLIFYGRSGDLLASAPFFILILIVIFGNEFLSKRSNRLIYNLSLYFIGIFSYIVLVIPVLTGHMGDVVFVLSGIVAVLWVWFVVKLLFRIVPNFMVANIGRVIVAIGFIYIGFNALYFTSLIPPIPLSLTELEIVDSIERTDRGYRITTQEQSWYRVLPFFHPVIHPSGNALGCFARVYAPTRLSTEIFHRWEFKNEMGEWEEHFRFGYGISGVNDGGYGGYTLATNLFDGQWRCSVETERGQVLGREIVTIDTTKPPRLTVVEFK